MFVRCSVWREYAENAAESLAKGMRVIVTGRMTVRSYEANTGEKRQSIELQVDEIGPSLRYARARVARVAPNTSQASQDRFSGPQSGGIGNHASAGYSASQSRIGDPAGNIAQMDFPSDPPF
jgi:single-strand DNA-binding protein